MGLDLPTASLVAYQKQLQEFLEANEEKVSQARAQLQNVEALLASLPATVAKAGKKVAAKVSAAVVELAPPPAPVKVSKKEAKAAAAPKKAEAKAAKPAGKPGRRSSSITLRSAYQGSTLTEAIEKVLQERKGQYVNADGVVDALYGDLAEDVLKVAKERVTKNLSKGKIEGKWERVPEQLGYYTLSLKDASASAAKSTVKVAKTTAKAAAKTTAKATVKATKKVEAEPKVSKKAAKAAPAPTAKKAAPAPTAKKAAKAPAKAESGRSGSIKLRSSYQGSTLTEAIEKVLQERKGEYVNADSVVKALYGELTPDVFRVAKERVTKNLSKGKIEGKWERVPEQLGYYTLSLAAIKA
ncbi:hypothetical protein V2H45_13640 [Tumidithrix elongata RA019]|uniref:Uncharacterized protein n=1 Tax=Tumidithrix elongata BACA0141 TaxID=2716417 RepID=A0AAW9Q1R2_9CYAN|nr:hypothetical protein [Tumidithrix elongata RA019]